MKPNFFHEPDFLSITRKNNNMRKTLLSFLLSFFALWGFSQQDVTFSVDMTPEAGNFTTVYVSGSFNGWSVSKAQ